MAQLDEEQLGLSREFEAAKSEIGELREELARAQRDLAAAREDQVFRRAVIEQASEGVCVCHDVAEFPFVKFTVWNRRMVEITGFTMEQINERGWYQSVYPDPGQQERARRRMERMRRGDNLAFERWTITRADGEQRVLAISTSVLTAGERVHVLGLMHDCTAEERLRKEEALARLDGLTGLKNRRGFEEAGALLTNLARRDGRSILVAYVDVDDFKSVNDSRGHAEGDRLLVAIARELGEAVRASDVLGRVGGDEFALLCLGSGGSDETRFLEKLHARLDSATRRDFGTGVSMGVARCPGGLASLGEALRRADALMYQAKRAGKGRLVAESEDG